MAPLSERAHAHRCQLSILPGVKYSVMGAQLSWKLAFGCTHVADLSCGADEGPASIWSTVHAPYLSTRGHSMKLTLLLHEADPTPVQLTYIAISGVRYHKGSISAR